MNFFERQDQAQRKTTLLVVFYILALVATVLAIHSVIVGVTAAGVSPKDSASLVAGSLLPVDSPLYWRIWFLPSFLAIDSLIVLLVIGGASWIKTIQLKSGGGDGVALNLGGTLIKPSTSDFQEKRLLNIVEEMAIASGIHVPNVYVLKEEHGINAFAAGYTPATSVIAVTQGSLDYLDRDELQGVIGHEFSHILHQDTNLNLRLIGVLFGLEMLVILGLVLCRSTPRLIYLSGRNDRNNGAAGIALAVVVVGLGLVVVGLIGKFFSNMIRAAISRQREFLADASSVQYTRNPEGIAHALTKIGCPRVGSRVDHSHSVEAAHLFFGSVFSAGFLSNLFDSHPDLTERIRRVEPQFDGKFPNNLLPIDPVTGRPMNSEERPKANVLPGAELLGIPSRGGAGGGMAGPSISVGNRAIPVVSGSVAAAILESVGDVNPKKLQIASALLEKIPNRLIESVRTVPGAMAAIAAVLFDPDPNVRMAEEGIFHAAASDDIKAEAVVISAELAKHSAAIKIPVVELAFSTLKSISKDVYLPFRKMIVEMIQADGRVDVLEFTLYSMLIRDLDRQFGLIPIPKPKYDKMDSLLDPFYKVMAFFAWNGNDNPDEVRKAFDAGCGFFYLEHPLPPKEESTPAVFSEALSTLGQATFVLRHKLLTAFYCCIAADGRITEREGELIRAVAAYFESPMPTWDRWSENRS